MRTLRKRNRVSQKDLAEYLGVAQNTIANYENNKRFPDQVTLNAIATYFNATLDSLLGRMPLENRDRLELDEAACQDLRKQLIDHILVGREKEAIQIILEKADSNKNIFFLFEQVIRKTLIEIGGMWHQGILNVSWEHYATGVIDKTLTLLSAKLKAEKPNKKVAICMSYSSDPHSVGVKMVSEYLISEGYVSYYLGVNTTTDSLIDMINQLRPNILAISVTLNYHLDGLKNLIVLIRSRCDCTQLKIMVGGQAFNSSKDQWKQSGADGYSTDLKSLHKSLEVS